MGQALSDYYSPSAPTNEIIVPEIAPEQSPNLFVIAAFTRNDNTGDKHTALTPSHFIPAAEAIIKPEELASYTLDYIDVEMPKFSFPLTAAQIPSKWLTDPVRRIDHENEVFKLQAEVDHAGNEKDKTSQQLLSMQKESNARFAQLLAEMSAMRGEMTDLRGEVTDLQDKVTRREKEITRLQKQVDDLLTRLSQEEARSTDLADQVADLNATIVAMAAELDVVCAQPSSSRD
ncbi:hypothetical protein BV25DRAFT_1994991 [Artomyces pyxidatus]|uniref:Uncharacterized protein n=1 Tax=Artomyces pyxidatus TaxID=48021 RepID=A0ACB8SLD3_9AGAM|nr:hypothetical protein BV25DRAFT_1994991 [Artomyces pyxidatus]